MTRAAIMPKWMEERLAGTGDQSGVIELAPDEAQAFALFASLGTQWHRHGMTGMRMCIDYAAIEPTARMMGTAMTPALFHDLRTMEDAALGEFAKAVRR